MKKFFLYILLVGVLGMLTVSCSDEFDSLGLESRKAQVMFSIDLDTPTARSRANGNTWGDKYTPSRPGDEYDNHIDINQFIVKMTDGDGNVYKISDIVKWQLEDDENKGIPNEYGFVGIVEGITEKTILEDVKIQIYANMGNDEDADFENMTFQQNAANIPMWGVKTIESLDLTPGTRVKAGDIFLLRAMAKFEVSISSTLVDKGYELTDVKLNKFNRKGNFMPTGYATVSETTILGQEAVLNENYTVQDQNVSLPALEENKKYVVYLPEISNTTESELKMLLTFKKGTDEFIETEVVVKDYTEANTGLINIVRNHWYQYEIMDIVNGQPEVYYNVVQWVTKNIEVGGAGFLGLSTDLVEVFSANTGTLQFVSSSPIVDVRLSDIYKHEKNGTFTEGTADGVKAYYITKFGKKTELGQNPGFTIANQETELARETQILNYIDNNVEWSEDVNEGTITVDSPYMTHDEFTAESHNDTPRYLEFSVTNQQGLTATFRMVQYPPVVITNVEGYFSYREDMRVGNLFHDHDPTQFLYEFGKTKPEDKNDEPNHYLNPGAPFFNIANFFPYHRHECTKDGIIKAQDKSCGTYVGFDEMIYGMMERDYCRLEEYKGSPKTAIYHRKHYILDNGEHFIATTLTKSDYDTGFEGNEDKYYQNLGPCYYDEKEGKYYRRHYTGDGFQYFYSKYVSKVYENGKADMCVPGPDIKDLRDKVWDSWRSYGTLISKGNHHMYHIRSTKSSAEYTIAWPEMVVEHGRYYTAESEANSRLVSPSFMVASQLGHTSVPKDNIYYTVPKNGGLYPMAKRHCEQYAEAVYKDTNNNGNYDAGEPVTHYKNWRLPTKAELEVINQYQSSSRAMDEVLTKEAYFCASTSPILYDNNTVLFNRGTKPNEEITDNHIRCVRDVKSSDEEIKYYN